MKQNLFFSEEVIFMKGIQYNGKKIIQYIGIAADEPRRLKRLDDTHISLLNKYHYTE